MERIAAIILAAGGAVRLGRSKPLLTYGGQSLVRRAVQAATGAACAPVIVVAGAEAEGVSREIEGSSAQIVQNPAWQRGIGTSIRKGVEELFGLAPPAAAVVLMVCDQPFVTNEVVTALIAARAESGKLIAASAYSGTLGVPALFDRSYFGHLASLPDDQGAKQVIALHRGDVVGVAFPQGATDIDTAADYQRLKE